MTKASQKELNYVRQLLVDDEPELAIKELRNLYKRYPNDAVVLQNLGSVLLKQGNNVSEALYLLSLATNRHNIYAITFEIGSYYLSQGDFERAEEKFKYVLDGTDTDKCYGYLGLIRTYIHTEDYETALDYFNKLEKINNLQDFSISHLFNLKSFLYYKNGIKIDEFISRNYFTRQLFNYSKEEAIRHIKEHLKSADSEELETKRFHSVFTEETDIEALYDYCTEFIKEKKPDGYGIVDYFKCEIGENIGFTYSKKDTNYVEVITFPNSTQILSIYPTNKAHINKISSQKPNERIGVLNQRKKKKKVHKKNHK